MRGHIRQRGRTWCVVLDVGRHPETGRRKQKWFNGYTTKGQAERALVELLGKRIRGERIDPDMTPLADYIMTWIENRESLAPLSVTQYTSVHRNHIAGTTLGTTPLGRIRRADVRAFDKGLRDKGLSLSTRRVIRAVLSRSLGDALADDLINSNPCLGAFARGESASKDPGRFTLWTESELRDLLATAEGERLAALWRVLVTCGLRRGEVLGLTWLGFGKASETLTVAQQAIPTRGGVTLTPLKTKGSHRTITLDEVTVAAIDAHRTAQNIERAFAGDAYVDRDLIFANELGGPLTPQRVTDRFNTLRKAAGIRPGRLHDLRHTHASHLLAAGVPISLVAARLGHSSPIITLGIYSHVFPSSDRDAVNALARSLR